MLQKLADCLVDAARGRRASFSPHILQRLERLRQEYAESLGGVYCEEHWLEVCAQTLTWADLAASLAQRKLLNRRGYSWIISQERPLWKKISQIAVPAQHPQSPRTSLGEQPWSRWLDGLDPSRSRIDLSQLYERFLATWSRQRRAQQGIYFTPPVIAQSLVKLVDAALRHNLGLPLGLAQETDVSGAAAALKVRILDPAAGSGVFLIAAIDHIHRTMLNVWRKECLPASEVIRRWNAYVGHELLPRLFGLELSPAASLVAHLEIAQKLADTGYAFADPAHVQIYTANTLARENDGVTSHLPMTVILGNPPFAALSQNRSSWIEGLLKGVTADGRPTASYFQVDGQPLAERKHWLHDDYVKFLRYAQWRIEQAGVGVVGLVTNHGYLDNPTFRGVRRQLMQAFTRIEIVDLHGNRKKREQAPSGQRDENVFDIEQGVALSVFCRAPGQQSSVSYTDLWGTREDKQRLLADTSGESLTFAPLHPTPPFYFFVPRDESHRTEYERGWRLPEIMPVCVAAPVTARDRLVVAFTRKELLERIAEFRDLSIPDSVIRERYFGRPRTARYPPGDTRGWKLAEARRQLAQQRNWKSEARTCLYRPFDRRWIYWSEAMIDWPRRDVMRHLEEPGNLALIARRQMPPTEPCSYFWVTDDITLDGVIRSDNRGGESLFPLYLYDSSTAASHPRKRQANFSADFLREFAAVASPGGSERGESAGHSDLSPSRSKRRDVRVGWQEAHATLAVQAFYFLYALFHAPSYRARFADLLRIDFPRVFLPRRRELLVAMSELGKQLVDAHLLRGSLAFPRPQGDGNRMVPAIAFCGNDRQVATGFPRCSSEGVAINRSSYFAGVSLDTWAWRAGGHQVARKWLKDRRGRVLADAEVMTFGQIATAIAATQRLSEAIDTAINQYGGWPSAFLGSPANRREERMFA